MLCSFSLIRTYIYGHIVDCLSLPYNRSTRDTFKEAYWIFLWSDFAHSKTCIIGGVLYRSIPYVVGVRCSAPLPWSIHISTGRLLSLWADIPAIVQVGPSRRRIESSCGHIFPHSETCIIRDLLSWSITYIIGVRCSAPSHWSIHISVGRLLTVWANLPAIVLLVPSRRRIDSSFGRILYRSETCIIGDVLPRLIPYIFGVRCSTPSHQSVYIYVGRLLTFWFNLLTIVWLGPSRRRIESSCGSDFTPSQDLYHRGSSLLVNYLYCLCWCSATLPRSIHLSAVRLLTVGDDLPAIVRVGPSRRCIESSCGWILPVPRPVSSGVYSPGRLPTLLAFSDPLHIIDPYIYLRADCCMCEPTFWP